MAKYKLLKKGVLDTERELTIPEDEDNRHWKEYLQWLLAGNLPDPADPDPLPPTDDEIIDRVTDAADPMKKVLFDVLYELVSRVATLEANPVPTQEQFRTWLKGKL